MAKTRHRQTDRRQHRANIGYWHHIVVCPSGGLSVCDAVHCG